MSRALLKLKIQMGSVKIFGLFLKLFRKGFIYTQARLVDRSLLYPEALTGKRNVWLK